MHHNSSNVHSLINISTFIGKPFNYHNILIVIDLDPIQHNPFFKVKFVTCLGRLVRVDEEVYLLNGKI